MAGPKKLLLGGVIAALLLPVTIVAVPTATEYETLGSSKASVIHESFDRSLADTEKATASFPEAEMNIDSHKKNHGHHDEDPEGVGIFGRQFQIAMVRYTDDDCRTDLIGSTMTVVKEGECHAWNDERGFQSMDVLWRNYNTWMEKAEDYGNLP